MSLKLDWITVLVLAMTAGCEGSATNDPDSAAGSGAAGTTTSASSDATSSSGSGGAGVAGSSATAGGGDGGTAGAGGEPGAGGAGGASSCSGAATASACAQCCEAESPQGYSGFMLIFYSCSCGMPANACGADCADSKLCNSPNKPLSDACVGCLATHSQFSSAPCGTDGAQCSSDAGCAAFLGCIQSCPMP